MRLGAMRLGPASPRALSVPVRKVLRPPDYFEDEARGDLALLQLRRPVPLSTRVQPVCLPEPGVHPPPGTPCWVTGWGSLHPGGEAEGGARGGGGEGQVSPTASIWDPVRPPPPGTQTSQSRRSVSGVASPTHPCLLPHPFSSLSHVPLLPSVPLPEWRPLQGVRVPLLDSHTCDRLYHVGTNVPLAQHIVLPGNLCAGYIQGHKDACQVREGAWNLWSQASVPSTLPP